MRSVTAGGRPLDTRPARSERSAEGFQEWLRGQLKTRKMSQRQLAQKSGVDHSSISRLVRGDRVPSLRTAMLLARGIDPVDQTPGDFGPRATAGENPAARVEYALRGDDRLNEADIRQIMMLYLAARTGRSMRPATTRPAGRGTRAPVPIIARTE